MADATGRQVGAVGLTLTGIGTIIGSGWLFGAAHAAEQAGPAAIFSWIIGAFIIGLIALTLAEIGPMFPDMGGLGRYSQYTHGGLTAFIGDWACFIGFVSSIPSEASASVQYASSWDYPWAKALFDDRTQTMSTTGLLAASALCIVYFFLNYFSLQMFLRAIKSLTLFKIAIPVLTIVVLIWTGWNPDNFHSVGGSIAPYGWAGVLTAITTAGIVYAYNGFQVPINFAGEAHNPRVSVPVAVLGSLFFCMLLYLGLQVAFIGAMPADLLKGGWSALSMRSPFGELAVALGVGLVAQLLYVDSVVSPSGSGIIYVGASARMLFGMERDGHMPAVVGRLDARTLLPRPAMWVVLVLAIASLWMFPSWDELAAIISVGYVISYLCPTTAVGTLRRIAPQIERPLHIRGMSVIAPAAFVASSFLLYWSRWPLTGQILFMIAGGLLIYLFYEWRRGFQGFAVQLRGAAWLICYMPAMALVSYLGSPVFGGNGLLPLGIDQAVVAVVSLGFYFWALRAGWRTPAIDARLIEVTAARG
ncbi:MAG: APC family permease [Ferrovibrionaceae bacterium]